MGMGQADVDVVDEVLRGKEEVAYADACYTGAQHQVTRKGLRWEIAAWRRRIKALPDGLISVSWRKPSATKPASAPGSSTPFASSSGNSAT